MSMEDIEQAIKEQTELLSKKYKKQTNTGAVAMATVLAPKVPFRLISVALKIGVAGTTSESFTVTKDAGLGSTHDQLLDTQNTATPAITDLYLSYGEGYEFESDDEIDCAWPNTEGRTWSVTYIWQPL